MSDSLQSNAPAALPTSGQRCERIGYPPSRGVLLFLVDSQSNIIKAGAKALIWVRGLRRRIHAVVDLES